MINGIVNLLMHDKQDRLRQLAIETLGRFHPPKQIIDLLFDIIADKNTGVRRAVLELLNRYSLNTSMKQFDILLLALEENENVNKLISALSDEDTVIRSNAFHVLGNVSRTGPPITGKIVVGLINNLLKNKNQNIKLRGQALGILVRINTAKSINGILWALNQKNKSLRTQAYNWLAEVDLVTKSSPEIIAALVKALKYERPGNQFIVRKALLRIRAPEAVKAVKQYDSRKKK
jgi:HEAT repeat protein